MRQTLIAVFITLLLATVPAHAEFKSRVGYHDWDGFPLTFSLAYVLNNDHEISAELHSYSLIEGNDRSDAERWLIAYGPRGDIRWRIGAVFSQSMEMTRQDNQWKQTSSDMTLRPFGGIALTRSVSDWLDVRLGADILAGENSQSMERRVFVELFAAGLVLGYTVDSDETYTGPHIAYEFHVF